MVVDSEGMCVVQLPGASFKSIIETQGQEEEKKKKKSKKTKETVQDGEDNAMVVDSEGEFCFEIKAEIYAVTSVEKDKKRRRKRRRKTRNVLKRQPLLLKVQSNL